MLTHSKRRNSFTNAVVVNINNVSINEQYFKNHKPIAVGAFDGTLESFSIAIGNISANCQLRSFGLHSTQKVLTSLEELFYDKKIGEAYSVAIAYQKTFLCQIVNNNPMVMTDSVLFLDIADVMETAGKVVVAQSPDCSRFLRKDSGKLVDDEGDYGSARSLLLSASVTVLFLTLALLSTYYP